jgi:hypothetical protein
MVGDDEEVERPLNSTPALISKAIRDAQASVPDALDLYAAWKRVVRGGVSARHFLLPDDDFPFVILAYVAITGCRQGVFGAIARRGLLLEQYFSGYTVTSPQGLLGLGYGLVSGSRRD